MRRGALPPLLTTGRAVGQLGKRIRDGRELPNDREAFTQYRQFLVPMLPDSHDRIQKALEGMVFLLACRVKRLDSLRRKLQRERSAQLEGMDDIVGLRVLVESPLKQQEAVERLQQSFEGQLPDNGVRDYLSYPRKTGYRAIHLIPRYDLRLPGADRLRSCGCEIQVRTYYQHLWSSTSESFGEQVKEGGGSVAVRDYLKELSAIIQSWEQCNPGAGQMDPDPQLGKLTYFQILFDKTAGQLLRCESIGSDGSAAVRSFAYLESLSPDKLTREPVLLGTASTQRQLETTHLRYFAPLGIPAIPSEIKPERPRPQR